MGQRLISLKGDILQWRGRSRLTVNDRGQRKFLKLENGYVSADGSEIRSFPGYATFIDLTATNNANGYERYVPDAVRPVLNFTSPLEQYYYQQEYTPTISQSLWTRAKPSHFFGFEQIGNEIFIFGESRFREDPIYGSSPGASAAEMRLVLDIATLVTTGATWSFNLGMPDEAGVAATSTPTVTDVGPGLNGLRAEDIVYIESLVVTPPIGDADVNDRIDAELNGKFHRITGITTGQLVTLATVNLTAGVSTATATAGTVHRIRPNRADYYGTPGSPSGLDPYDATYDNRPDDPDALTVWRVIDKPTLLDANNNLYDCYPAFVANRQRDFGDVAIDSAVEGIIIDGAHRGASRREQRRLPFRPNVETALNRIILAVPQYGCMFQIPALIPIDPSLWPSPGGTSDLGLVFPCNNLYDKPRALGIPKPRMIDSVAALTQQTTPAISSPGDFTVNVSLDFGDPQFSFTAGTYKVAIAFEDVGTGEEGLASEPVEAIVADASPYSATISINYVHPGYHFSECLATKVNVYIAPPGEEALAFYGSFELKSSNYLTGLLTEDGNTAVYGNAPASTPNDPFALIRKYDLPLLTDQGDLTTVLDPSRLAPQSATMPRGAEACRYVRGVLFAGGALGNAGSQGQLWRNEATVSYAPGSPNIYSEGQLRIQAHATTDAQVPSASGQDGDTQAGTLGIAGRAFPDAYQGIEVITGDLFPGTDAIKTIDRVRNRWVPDLAELAEPTTFREYHAEILDLQRDAVQPGHKVGTSPDWAGTSYVINRGDDVFYVMPRGQLQIGDPGAPWRSSRAFIKVIDPNEGDDITAIGHLGGNVIICTKKETYSYAFYRNPAGDEINTMSRQHGCIAGNSMVEFDGGVAWLSERGPVALGGGLQFVGQDVSEDFYGQDEIYMRDSTGLMRHSWGHHDSKRGLIMWGLLRRDGAVAIEYEGTTYTTASTTPADGILSRFPCDEVLIWSYRAQAFSTWKPPAGLEIYWMRDLRDSKGTVRTCFLAADGRIYALDDEWSDANGVANSTQTEAQLLVSPSAAGSGTTLSFTGASTFQDGDTAYTSQRNLALFLRAGMLVEFVDAQGDVTADTTIASVTTTAESGTSTIELSATQTWLSAAAGQRVRIGGRQRMTIISNYIGAETMDVLSLDAIQMRYTLAGSGSANARVKAFRSEDGTLQGEEARVVNFTENGKWEALGWPKTGSTIPSEIDRFGRRKRFAKGGAETEEVAVSIEITGEAQVRIQDIGLEVG